MFLIAVKYHLFYRL